jgi:transcriptional regulator with PAS, ATPase and Fis domain
MSPWIGRDPAFLDALARLELAAPSMLPVLVLGETGTGKELAARALHAGSPAALGPFVAVNCGALPDPLIESELFGSTRGAFTGALDARAGLVEAAEHGTLFLDEIGDASPLLQMKLLRLLDRGEFRRVGETRTRRAMLRVVAATHQDLARGCAEGRFRADLWYRLAAVEVTLPPLRARGDDVLLLARAFVARARAGALLDADACRALREYPWPGNVRERAHAMASSVLFARAGLQIDLAALPPRIRGALEPEPGHAGGGATGLAPGLANELQALERERIEQALEEAGGNRARAARRLGISRQGLWRKLKRRAAELGRGDTLGGEGAWRRRS